MSEDSYRDLNSINNLESEPIKKQHKEYLIKVNKNSNSSLDIIIKENDFYYESNFTEDDIQKKLKTKLIKKIYYYKCLLFLVIVIECIKKILVTFYIL